MAAFGQVPFGVRRGVYLDQRIESSSMSSFMFAVKTGIQMNI